MEIVILTTGFSTGRSLSSSSSSSSIAGFATIIYEYHSILHIVEAFCVFIIRVPSTSLWKYRKYLSFVLYEYQQIIQKMEVETCGQLTDFHNTDHTYLFYYLLCPTDGKGHKQIMRTEHWCNRESFAVDHSKLHYSYELCISVSCHHSYIEKQ